MKQLPKIFVIVVLVIMSLVLTGCGGVYVNNWPGSSYDEGTLYLASQTGVFAVDASNGNMLWRYPEKADSNRLFFSSPTKTSEGQLIVGDFAKDLVGLDAKTGKELWSFKQDNGRWVAAPAVAGNLILAPSADHYLYALDLKGNLLMEIRHGRADLGHPGSGF